MTIKQTSCKFCGQDIEGNWPYRKNEWRDRGNNATCPYYPANKGYTDAGPNVGKPHAPIK